MTSIAEPRPSSVFAVVASAATSIVAIVLWRFAELRRPVMRGSRNHMHAFNSLVELRGFTYAGTFLPATEVAAILASGTENVPVDENGQPLR